MAQVTGEEIYEALVRDPKFIMVPESTHTLWREICQTIPEILSDLLPLPVTASTFAQAKAVYLKYIIESNWMERLIRAYVVETPGSSVSVQVTLEKTQEVIMLAQTQFQEAALHIENILSYLGMFEEQFLETFGRFNEETLARWHEGTLTLDALMRQQPVSLFLIPN